MQIPPFTIDGILPPYIGQSPAHSWDLMSPFKTTVAEVVQTFGTTPERREILAGWLAHRMDLRSIGITRGIQWLDGSFLEDKETIKKEAPADIDVLFLFYRPSKVRTNRLFQPYFSANYHLFDRATVKNNYHVDFWPLDMDGDKETLISLTRYILLLFSHQRDTSLWKGMLEVRQEDSKEDAALFASLTQPTGGNP